MKLNTLWPWYSGERGAAQSLNGLGYELGELGFLLPTGPKTSLSKATKPTLKPLQSRTQWPAGLLAGVKAAWA